MNILFHYSLKGQALVASAAISRYLAVAQLGCVLHEHDGVTEREGVTLVQFRNKQIFFKFHYIYL